MEESKKDGSIFKLPIFFWITVTVAILSLAIFIFKIGITFWFLILLLMWVWFIFSTKKAIDVESLILQKSIIILIGFIVVTLVFIKFGGNNNSASNNTNTEEASGGIGYLQDESYEGTLDIFFDLGTEFNGDGGAQTRMLNYKITNFIRLYPLENIIGARYKNIKLQKVPAGELVISLPTGGYSEKFINDGSHVIEIPVMKTEDTMSANQIFGNFALLSLQIDIIDAFQFDVNEAYKNSDHGLWTIDGIKAAKINPSDLDNTLEFDIEIEFESGKKIIKHFTGNISGSNFLAENESWLSDINLDVK